MEMKVIIVFIFTLVIHLISTLSYSVRLVGLKTGRIAVTVALFNILALCSGFSNSFQAPFFAKFVESDVPFMNHSTVLNYFLFILSAAGLGTLIGGFITPSFQRILTVLVYRFNIDKSLHKLLFYSLKHFSVNQIKNNLALPSKHNIDHVKDFRRMPMRRIVMNSLIIALLTVGTLSSLYAATIAPQIRLTASSLVPIITGLATITSVLYIEPYFSLLTDDILNGKTSIVVFHKSIVWLVISRFVGTLLAIILLVPCAELIVFVAQLI
jgi:hypothetical protein